MAMIKALPITWKMRGRLAGGATLCAAFVAANVGTGGGVAAARTGNAGATDYGQSRPDLSVAQVEAREYLDQFFAAVIGQDGVARSGAAMRIALKDRNGRTEEVWVTPFALRNGILVGVLADAPRRVAGRNAGDLITFGRADVRDWSFFGAEGRMYGNFTTRLMLSTVAPAQAAEIAAVLSETPAPVDWLHP